MASSVAHVLDEGSFEPRDLDLRTRDPLGFPGYAQAVDALDSESGARDSLVAGRGLIGGREIEAAFFDFGFLGGSMGEVAGERLARSIERAARRGVPFLLRTATGGARMQEGMRSLVQMPKVVTARLQLARSAVPFIAMLGHPTTGGVLASLGALADYTLAEAGATIGFAGPRVAEAFTGRALSGETHSAESALSHGLVDEVVEQADARRALEKALMTLSAGDARDLGDPGSVTHAAGRKGWEVVEAARAQGRLNVAASLADICDDYIELRGDRAGSDDPGVRTVIAHVGGRRAVLLAHDRTRPPAASGFRKARRCVEIAGRLGLPVVTLVDTRGANPSEASEKAGVAWAIAQLFETLLQAPVPVISIVTGEGGSGGALAFAVGDVLAIYESAFFSVIGPEGAAQILWREPRRAAEAAEVLDLTAPALMRLGIADEIVPEPLDAQSIRRVVAYHLDQSDGAVPAERLVQQRQARWRSR